LGGEINVIKVGDKTKAIKVRVMVLIQIGEEINQGWGRNGPNNNGWETTVKIRRVLIMVLITVEAKTGLTIIMDGEIVLIIDAVIIVLIITTDGEIREDGDFMIVYRSD
jgi:hypothetical protein